MDIKLIKEEPAKVQEALTYWLTLKQAGLPVSTYQEVFNLMMQEFVAVLNTYTDASKEIPADALNNVYKLRIIAELLKPSTKP